MASIKQHPAFAPGGCHNGLFRDMQGELPKYGQLVKNIKGTRDVVQFFKLNNSTTPAFAEASKIANLVRALVFCCSGAAFLDAAAPLQRPAEQHAG